MKVVIVAPYRTVGPHFETELELAQVHLDQGDDVDLVSCLGELPCCDFNPERKRMRCSNCISRREHGIELLSERARPIRHRGFSEFGICETQSVQKAFTDVKQLERFSRSGFDLGYAALSSLVSLTRESAPDLVKHRLLLQRIIDAAWITFQATTRLLDTESYDRVYVFNGRFASMRAVLRACQQASVDCYLHERGCDIQHYQLYKNALPHNLQAMETRMLTAWDQNTDLDQRAEIGARWFLDRRNRVERNWKSFVKQQTKGKLPAQFDKNLHNIGLFTSSDDEFVAIGDSWKNDLYENQELGIQKIVDSLRRQTNVHLYIRIHPNLVGTQSAQLETLLGIDQHNVTVLAPDNPVDTYAMVDAVDTVVSFGSSIGVEATYWGKPSVLLGPSFYQNFGCNYRPIDHEHTMQLLTRPLAAQDTTGALVYGHWLQSYGTPFKYYRADGIFEGKFKNQVVYARANKKLSHKVFYKLHRFSDSTQRIARYLRERLLRSA